ncbi:MAG: DEAD/DEAH box helicase family protein [Candidatus Micrarchaeales archaeon]|nr:DEAD/DEAH box helicase family protein [Candidatus Micrarchaeales archaeon]
MSFKKLELKIAYESGSDDVLSEFFIPILKESKLYKRVSAYYSSDSIRIISEGLATLIYNNGAVKLLVSHLVNEKDYDAILEAKTKPEEVLSKTAIGNREELEKLMEDDNVAALAYLLAANRLEIKFALCRNESAIFHLKFGIFEDFNDNLIGFSGSINETYMGLKENVEEFKVFKGWVEEEKKYLEGDLNKFDGYWNRTTSGKDILIVDLPEKTKQGIISEFKRVNEIKNRLYQPMSLRPMQDFALKSWVENGRHGILQMATGSGKTLIGTYAILNLFEECKNDGLVVVIGCPTKALAKQWYERLSGFNLGKDCSVFTLNNTITRDELYKRIKYGEKRKTIVIGVYNTIHKSWFVNELLTAGTGKLALIADEVHWLGAKEFSNAMTEKYSYRLGLTATPVRNFDMDGTNKILTYFKGITYNYPMSKAIKDGILTPYMYKIYEGKLNNAELAEYKKLTKKYARYSHFPKEKYGDLAGIILAKRAKIIKKAESKVAIFREIIKKLKEEGKLKLLLVYCEDNIHIQEFRSVLNEFGVESRIVKDKMTDDERGSIIKDFENGNVECIIAMKIFDEGLDIPAARTGIFVSSTSNPKQFIQRRGRLLRKAHGKKEAEIYDIIIVPGLKELDTEMKKIEGSIIEKEIKRALVFSSSAKNAYECNKALEKICANTNINLWNLINSIGNEGE